MSELTFGRLHWSDVLVIALYYAGTIAIGIWSICKTKNSLHSFFLANNSITWWPVGLSLFASNIGSINFVGIAGTGAASGLAVIMFEWNAVFLLILLAWVFLPVYISSGIYTIPEYLNIRFGGQRLRIYLSVIAVLTYIFAIMAVDLYSGALFIKETLNLNIYIGVAIILATTFLFTTMGGLLTVVFTDAFAVVVMVLGGFVLFILGMIRLGGITELKILYMAAVPNVTYPNSTCGYPREDAWHIFRHPWTADFPAVGTFLRTSVMGSLWFWCCNQMIVQRSLAAKNITHAKAGSILASYLKLTPLLIMILPGMMARALFPNEVGCATPATCLEVCGNSAGCSNIAYPRLATELLPHGFRGLLIAAMIAAVISSLTSIFNSTSSIITMDIWRQIRPQASEKELLIVGKAFLLVLTVIAVVWIPIMESAEGGQIYQYSNAANGLFGGPTCSLFLVAIFWGRINEKGAFWGLMAGQAWGLLRFILDAIFPKPHCFEIDDRPMVVRGWHVSYHICSQVIITACVAAIISYLTKPLPSWRLTGTTYWTCSKRHIPERVGQLDEENKNLSVANGHAMEIHEKLNGENAEISASGANGVETNDNEDKSSNENDHGQEQGNLPIKKSMYLKIYFKKLFTFCCIGNENDDKFKQDKGNFENDMLHPTKFSSLKQSTRSTVILNVNAAFVILLTIILYICFY